MLPGVASGRDRHPGPALSARGAARRTDLLASVWFFPALAGLSATGVALGLLQVRPKEGSTLARLLWPADASAATSLLQTVAGSVMTATSLAFSLTVVALQLASQQFSPRLLREFARDRTIQVVMAVLVSAFVVPLVGLRGVSDGRPLPVLLLLLVQLLGLAAIGAVVAFVAHIVRALRVNTMMVAVHLETRGSISDSYPPCDGDVPENPDDAALPGPEGGVLLPLPRSGFVRAVHPAPVIEVARRHGVLLRLGLRPGDHVVTGAPLGSAFPDDGRTVDAAALVREVLQEAVDLGYERTSEQDAALGFRQLVDIACKAISPGVNDPTTCIEALGHCADLLVELFGRRLGPQLRRDDAGAPRVVLPDRDLRYYLDLCCAQVRRFGADQPEVLTGLLRLLRDCAAASSTDDQREHVEHQVRLVLAQASDGLLDDDLAAVHDAARRVRLALRGDVDGAYRDRAGETRSI